MSETASTESTTTAAEAGAETKTFTQADLDRIVGDRLARQRAQFGDYDDLKAKADQLAELERSQLSDRERLERERDEAKAAADAAKAEALTATLASTRLQVALEAGLPVEAAARLQGTNADELKADAEALAALLKPAERTPGPEDGVTPTGHRREQVNGGMTREQVQKLARENPARLNELLDKGELKLSDVK